MSSSRLKDFPNAFDGYGFEFFTNGPCLLLHNDKIDWLRDKLTV